MVLRVREAADSSSRPSNPPRLAARRSPVASGRMRSPAPSPIHTPLGQRNSCRRKSPTADPAVRSDIDRTTIDLRPTGAHGSKSRSTAAACRPRPAASEPVSEIELELKAGTVTGCMTLALDLLAVAPLRLEWRSKAERGYRLAAGSNAVEPVRAEPVTLDPRLSGDEALQRIGIACLEQILRNEAAVAAGDPRGRSPDARRRAPPARGAVGVR